MFFLAALCGSAAFAQVINTTINVPVLSAGVQVGEDCKGHLFAYEEESHWCIGGFNGGGKAYDHHHHGQPIKTLRVWMGGADDGVKAIQMETFGDAHGKTFEDTIGIIPARGADNTITFAPGEQIVGDITLCGNGVGTRLGHIGFKTSKDQTFSAGDTHTPYYNPADGTMLSGVFGHSGKDVNNLAFYLVKPIDHEEINNVHYPNLASRTTGTRPQILSFPGCNDGYSGTVTVQQTHKVTQGESSTWGISTTMGIEIGESTSVEAGIPELKVTSTFSWKWSVSATSSYSRTFSTTTTDKHSFTLPLEPRTRGTCTCQWFDSRINNLKYTGELTFVFKDGTNWNQSFSDYYQGVYTTNYECTRHVVNLTRGESCKPPNASATNHTHWVRDY